MMSYNIWFTVLLVHLFQLVYMATIQTVPVQSSFGYTRTQPSEEGGVLVPTAETVTQPMASINNYKNINFIPQVLATENNFYLVNEPGMCDGFPFLLIIVCSDVMHVRERMAIRETWGGAARRSRTGTKVIFFLGVSQELTEIVQSHIAEESSEHHDIVQANFTDTYRNLTLKSISMLHWVDTFCKGVKFVLKTDDDMFINVPLLLQDLKNSVHKHFIMGNVIARAQPIRDKRSKWYTPKSVYDKVVYPTYVSGTAYIISGDLIHDLYQATTRTDLFWLEDIYITGICASVAKANHIYNGKFGYKKRILNPCLFKLVITGHKLRTIELHKMWSALADPNLKCPYTRINHESFDYDYDYYD